MSREQTILEMEFEVAMSALVRVWDEIERTEVVADVKPVFAALGGAAKAFRALQMERKIVAAVVPEIGR